MWSLVPAEDGGQIFWLLAGRPYKLGRTNCDFNITSDKSISRHHATLEILHSETNIAHPHKPPVLKLTDSSKFGTHVQDKKVSAECIIKNSDVIKFGTLNSVYTALYEPYVVTTSCLDPGAKKQTKQVVSRLGAHMVSDWRKECQLLVMTSLSVTVKVICALVSLKPIVTVEYLEEMAKSIDKQQPLPDPDEFTPPLAESQLNPNEVSFQRDERRKTLFQGKVFIFLNPKQFKKLNIAVELAGGTPMLMEEGTDDNEDDILIQGTTCVMHCDPGDITQQLSQNAHDWIKHVFSVLKRNGRRPIPDCELGFAVLYCSTSRYCNPSSEAGSQVSSVPSQSLSQQASVSASAAASSNTRVRNSQKPTTSKSSAPPSTGPALGSETVQVKEEPKSHTPSQNKRLSKQKRAREVEDEDQCVPAAKLARLKEEEEDEDELVVPVGRNLRSKSRSPSPVPSSNTASHRQPRSPASTRSSRSPSPAPSKTTGRQRRKAREKTPEPKSTSPLEDEEPSDEFDVFRPRSKRRRSPAREREEEEGRDVSPEPTKSRSSVFSRVSSSSNNKNTNSEKKKERGDTKGAGATTGEADDPLDPFDDFKPRSRRRGRSPSPSTKVNTLSPAPSPPAPPPTSRERRTSPVAVKQEPPSARKEPGSQAGARRRDQGRHREERQDEEDTGLSSPRNKIKPKKEIKFGIDDGVLDHVPLADQWLSKNNLPSSDEVDRAKPTTDNDEPIPDGGMTTTFKSLMVTNNHHRPQDKNSSKKNRASSTVKNFKRFNKVLPAGAEGLPRIIGGSDLKLHTNDAREVDQWFEDEQQLVSKKSKESQEADALFSWEPSIRKKTGRR